MQVLPSGLVVPPLPYTLALAVLTAAAVATLYRRDPVVTESHVLAFAPWMVVGGALHGLYQFGLVPEAVAPLLAAPAVYVTTFVATAVVWIAVLEFSTDPSPERTARGIGLVGGAALAVLGAIAYANALGRVDTAALAWPLVGVLGAAVVTVPVYYALRAWRPSATAVVGGAGVVAIFAHALDGVSTAIGIDLLGTTERTPLPAHIMDFAGTLPTAQYIGQGWLFVLVKLLIAAGIVLLLADYVDEEPTEGYLLLAFVAAVGMGPAANNLTLFLLDGGV